MTTRAVTLSKVYLDAFDLSADTNAVSVEFDAGPEDASVLDGSGARKYGPTLESGRFSLGGLWQGGTDKVNEILAGRFAVNDSLLTLVPETGTDGDAVYSCRVLVAQYDAITGTVGNLLKYKASGEFTGTAFKGIQLASGAKASTGTGTILNPGAVSATQKLYGSLHVLAVSGGTLTVKIQSAPTVGFAAPVDRITFAGVTVRGVQWATPVAGAITDAFWRATWTLTAGTATIMVSMGIQ